MLQEFGLNLTAGFLMSLLLEMEIMHACPFDADDMGCVDPEGAAVAQSNPVVYNIQSAASVVASNKEKKYNHHASTLCCDMS